MADDSGTRGAVRRFPTDLPLTTAQAYLHRWRLRCLARADSGTLASSATPPPDRASAATCFATISGVRIRALPPRRPVCAPRVRFRRKRSSGSAGHSAAGCFRVRPGGGVAGLRLGQMHCHSCDRLRAPDAVPAESRSRTDPRRGVAVLRFANTEGWCQAPGWAVRTTPRTPLSPGAGRPERRRRDHRTRDTATTKAIVSGSDDSSWAEGVARAHHPSIGLCLCSADGRQPQASLG
jgi:hypothetical protein